MADGKVGTYGDSIRRHKMYSDMMKPAAPAAVPTPSKAPAKAPVKKKKPVPVFVPAEQLLKEAKRNK